jgi:TolB-like protein/tetratricopeptide (TPR) repeat protein
MMSESENNPFYPASSKGRKLRFATFEVDFQQRELRNRGIRIKLEGHPFRVLEVLLEKPGELVTREELAHRLWPDLHVSVDAGLNTAINLLRQALGDSGRNCRYIETRSRLGYRFVAHVEELAETSPVPPRDAATDSIAILPFENRTGDPGLDLLAEGIAENVIADLSRLEDVRVIARTTAFRFRTPEVEPRLVGNQLNVRVVLTGRVAQWDQSLLIRTELIEARTGRRLWGDEFNCVPGEIFATERRICTAVSRLLHLRAGARQRTRPAKMYTKNFEAYEDYLKGRYFYHKMTEDDLRKSIAYFESAIAHDADYALAYAGLADAYNLFAFMGVLSPAAAYSRAKKLAVTALEIDGELAEAHTSLAGIKKLFDWDWTGAEREYIRALQLSPNYADGHHWYAAFLSSMGRSEPALQEIRHALELDPLSLVINMELAWNLYMARDFRSAVEQSWKTLVLEPRFAAAQHVLGLAYEQLEMMEEAITELGNARICSGDHPAALAALSHAYATAGKRPEALQILHELEELSQRRYIPPYWMSLVHLGIGSHELAFEWMEEAYEQRDVWLVWLKVEPRFDPIRSDFRFRRMLEQLGL